MLSLLKEESIFLSKNLLKDEDGKTFHHLLKKRKTSKNH